MRTSGQIKAMLGSNKYVEFATITIKFYLRKVTIPVGKKDDNFKRLKESQINELMDGKIIYVSRYLKNDKYKLHEGKLYKQVENDWFQYSIETKNVMMERKLDEDEQ